MTDLGLSSGSKPERPCRKQFRQGHSKRKRENMKTYIRNWAVLCPALPMTVGIVAFILSDSRRAAAVAYMLTFVVVSAAAASFRMTVTIDRHRVAAFAIGACAWLAAAGRVGWFLSRATS